MFEFRHVELMNWAYWPTVKVPLDARTIMISGPNGSGKTTFLDALRTLLRAPRLSAGRRFTDYLIGDVETAVVKALVTNESGERERRPFEFKGFHGPEVTMAVVLKRRSGRWERRFAILEGNVGLGDLRQLRHSDMLTPETYTREIQEAGFTSAFLKVLALEQGQTDKLCEKSPRELLDLLLDVHGDKAVIERYKRARENYQAANMELQQLGTRLAEEQAHLLISEKAATDYKRYRKLVGELQRYEQELIPQAEYKAAREQIQQAELASRDLHARLKPVDREVLDVEEILDNAETELTRRKNQVLESRDTKENLDKEERDLDIRLNRLVEERRRLQDILKEAEGATKEDVGALERELEQARRELVRLDIEREGLDNTAHDLAAQVRTADQAPPKIYPHFVSRFVETLDDEGIACRLLCDLVEITDPQWQMAVESILGRDRFTVIVDAKDQLKARQLGEAQRYRCYVVAAEAGVAPSAPKDSALEVVRFVEDGIPDWIAESLARTTLVDDVQAGMKLGGDTVSVTRQGYRQDRRGGISIAVDHFYCGDLGRTAQQERLEKELNDARSRLGQIDKKVAEQRREIDAVEGRIRVQASLRAADEARDRNDKLDGEMRTLNAQHKQALDLRRQAEMKLIDALDELHNFERDIGDRRRQLMEKRASQSEYLDEIKDLQEQVKTLTARMDNIAGRLDRELLTDKALASVPEPDELTPRFYAVRNLLDEFEEPPDETAIDTYEHHREQYERQHRIYAEHEEGLRNWEQEFRLARQKYLAVVEHTIRGYRRNVLALAQLAGVEAEVVIPKLDAYEDILEAGQLVVRFGFDGKKAIDMGGSQLSGGQRVVASLILLMSLATSGDVSRGGFFIIDEPFAHLSLERIGDVSRFLEKTRCQFILTSPTTHNVNVFSAARLQLNFRIKKRGAEFAAVPTIIRR